MRSAAEISRLGWWASQATTQARGHRRSFPSMAGKPTGDKTYEAHNVLIMLVSQMCFRQQLLASCHHGSQPGAFANIRVGGRAFSRTLQGSGLEKVVLHAGEVPE